MGGRSTGGERGETVIGRRVFGWTGIIPMQIGQRELAGGRRLEFVL